MSYSKEEIAQGLAETFHYNCHKCGQGNLSRDEVTEILPATKGFIILNSAIKYICLKCHEKSNVVDNGGKNDNFCRYPRSFHRKSCGKISKNRKSPCWHPWH